MEYGTKLRAWTYYISAGKRAYLETWSILGAQTAKDFGSTSTLSYFNFFKYFITYFGIKYSILVFNL